MLENSRMLAGNHFKPSVLLQFDSSTNIPDVASYMQVSWSTCWTERKGLCYWEFNLSISFPYGELCWEAESCPTLCVVSGPQ